MTAFADYLDLRTAVLEDVGRTDIADKFDRITRLAEAYLNNKLRLSDQITSATVTFTSGVGVLPSGYREAIGLYDSNGLEYIEQPTQAVKPTGTSAYYSIQGSNIVSNALTGDLTFEYFTEISTITASMTTSNWLLQKYPSIYLYAVGAEAAKSVKDVDLAVEMIGLRDQAINEAMGDDEDRRFSRARVRVQGCTP